MSLRLKSSLAVQAILVGTLGLLALGSGSAPSWASALSSISSGETTLDRYRFRPRKARRTAELQAYEVRRKKRSRRKTSRSSGPKPGAPPAGVFTSLILDARGLPLDRSQCPRIRARDGRDLYGNGAGSWERAQAEGTARYVPALSDALELEVAGKKPLVVSLAEVDEQVTSNGIVEDDDADRILVATKKWDFRKWFRVIVLIDF